MTTSITNMPMTTTTTSTTVDDYLSNGIGINYYAMNCGAGAAGIKLANVTSKQQQHIYMQQQQAQLITALQYQQQQQQINTRIVQRERERELAVDSCLRRRLFAGFRPLSGFGRSSYRSPQHRSISLPESNISMVAQSTLPNNNNTLFNNSNKCVYCIKIIIIIMMIIFL